MELVEKTGFKLENVVNFDIEKEDEVQIMDKF
jgi:hypothetical protein